jgi:hypothetical protein
MKLTEHPILHVLSVLERFGADTFQVSVYNYEPLTVLDVRETYDIPVKELSCHWLEERITGLNDGEEIAFHSCFWRKKSKYHIPMIDLDCDPAHLEIAKAELRKVLPLEIYSGLMFYNSGRSLHAYGSRGITHAKWVEFMGRLLLANLPKKPPVVDARWIGHRLIGGYASLRWSSNTAHYIKMPTLQSNLL